MAQNVFNTGKIYKTVLWGHSFTDFPEAYEPELPGTFAADTVEVSGDLSGNVTEYAVFTVSEPSGNEYPAAWAGTYRLPYGKIVENPPVYVADVPEPEPDPDDDDGESDPADPEGVE